MTAAETSPTLLMDRRILWRAYIAAGFAIVLWSGTPAATRMAVLHMDPLAAAMMRTVMAAGIALPVLVLAHATRSARPRPVGRGQWGLLSLTAASGYLGFTVLFSLGTQMTSASQAALINASIPLFVGMIGVATERRMPKVAWFVGMLTSFAGVMALVTMRSGAQGDASLLGDVLCLASSVVAAVGYVSGSHLARSLGTVNVTFWSVVMAALVQAPLVYALWDAGDWAGVSPAGWLAVGFLALGPSLACYVAWYWGLAHGGVVRMAPLQFFMPVLSLTLAVTIFDEHLTLPLMLSAVAIVAGIVISKKT